MVHDDRRVRVQRRGVADALEPTGARGDMGRQNVFHAGAEHQFGEADDSRGQSWLSGRFPHDELGFPDRSHRLGSRRAVAQLHLGINRGLDAVAALQITGQLIGHVAPMGQVDEVEVRVDDGQIRLQNGLWNLLCQPCVPRWIDAAEFPAVGCRAAFEHCVFHRSFLSTVCR